MKLMRHSDIKLTAKVYTDETQLPIYDSIKNLPRLRAHTQIRAQILGANGQNEAQPDSIGEGIETHNPIENAGGSPSLTPLVAKIEMERVKGIEPSSPPKWF
jgi:hypothetical protein